jgi:hypothetical protein
MTNSGLARAPKRRRGVTTGECELNREARAFRLRISHDGSVRKATVISPSEFRSDP